MKKSHVTDEGEKVCIAPTPDKCRAIFNGEPAPHFPSMKTAREFYLNHLAEQNSDSMSNKTMRKNASKSTRTKLQEISSNKLSEIHELTTTVENLEERLRQLQKYLKAAEEKSIQFMSQSNKGRSFFLEKRRKLRADFREVSEKLNEARVNLDEAQWNQQGKRLPTATELGFGDQSQDEWRSKYREDETRYQELDRRHAEFDKIVGNLPKDQRKAVVNYVTADNYRSINEKLRNDPNALNYSFFTSESFRNTVENLDAAIEENSTHQKQFLYRGIYGDLAHQTIRAPIGTRLELAGFTSTSTEKEIAGGFSSQYVFNSDNSRDIHELRENFSQLPPSASIIFELQTDKGMFLSGGEQEQLLPRGTKWRIVGKRLAAMTNPNQGPGDQGHALFIQLADEDLLDL